VRTSAKHIAIGPWLTLCLASIASSPASAQVGPNVVQCHDGVMSVTADDADLNALLGQVARACAITVLITGTVDKKVSVGFADVELHAGFRRLLQGQAYVIEEPAAGGPLTVRVIGQGRMAAPVSVVETARTADAPELQALRAGLGSADPGTRMDAVHALADSRHEQATELLAPALLDPDEAVRDAAFLALVDLGGPAAAQALAAVLGDPRVDVRVAAVDALSQLEGTDTAALLAPAVRDADDGVRDAAFAALATMRGPEVVNVLALALRDRRAEVRAAAAYNLAEMDETAATALLRQAASDPAPSVRDAARQALQGRGG
jgi:hypothetical protein